MKKLLTLTVIVAFGALFTPAAAQQITGSAHDFSSSGPTTYAGTTDQICVYCHTPHNSVSSTDAPLWNHAASAAVSYTMYTNPTGTMNASIPSAPSGVSALCLSCHDGTTAVDNYLKGPNPGQTTKTLSSGAAWVGTNLGDDHPISISYLTGNGIKNTMGSGVATFGGKVECASCHDVHNGTGIAKMLSTSNANSSMCLACHQK